MINYLFSKVVVDFIKVHIREFNMQHLEENENLEFTREFVCSTGELKPKKKASYKNLVFTLYDSGLLIIQGSIHKYKNDGIHNYDDFSLNQIVEVLDEISIKFNLPLNKCRLRNFEVGVNINPQKKAETILIILFSIKD
ncbi:hypothetical protein [Aquimarina sp. RZ0]|uniref:hypothetical protein n=1 Tax=Aquimarina sp. RZ0 TaxID=2607730 RepID=UPI0011F2C3B7|nr:hypothetical protein [Aquimarina sp. RZ0]KAA1247980.1 hypothetical protein F0000_01810 [Aquimarina sp. RZ0]